MTSILHHAAHPADKRDTLEKRDPEILALNLKPDTALLQYERCVGRVLYAEKKGRLS